MSKFAITSAAVIAKGLAEGVEACRASITKLKADKGSRSEEDEIAKNELEMGIREMEMEIKNLSQCTQSDELVQKVEEYMILKWNAQKTLNELTVRLRNTFENDSRTSKPSQPPTPLAVFARLPEIEMTKFQGDILTWSEFWQQFSSNIHERKDMDDAIKFTYLKGFLEGEAKETIGGLQNTVENYKIAIDKLKDRYAKPKRILDAHYSALEELAPATSDIEHCRRVLNKIDIHMGILKSLGEDTNHNNFRIKLMKKFPPEILHDTRTMMKGNEDYSVDELREYIKQAIEAREETAHITKMGDQCPTTSSHFTTETLYAGQQQPPLKPGNKRTWKGQNSQGSSKQKPHHKEQDGNRGEIKKENDSSAKRSLSSSEPQSKEPPNKTRRHYACRFCKANHYNDQCDVLPTIDQRRRWVKENKLCYQCLASNHLSPACEKKRKCVHCGEFGKHNRCLCPSFENKQGTFENKQGAGNTKNKTNSLFSHADSSTILQTAIAHVMTSKGKRVSCRLLFDTGSEKSYLTTETERKLKPICKEQATLTIYTFGNRKPQTKNTALVVFSVLTNKGPVEVSAYVVPTTTGNIPSFSKEKSNIKHCYPSLLIAEDVDQDKPADIIIGNDFYYSFLTGGVQTISHQLYLLDSKLGWIISGCPNQIRRNSDSLSVLTFVQNSCSSNLGISTPDPALQDDKIRDLWELETIGITDSPKALRDDEAIHQFNKTTEFRDGRYFVKWPWAQYPPSLPINLGLALGRLKGLVKRIDGDRIKQYNDVLQEQLKKGIIEHVRDQALPTTHPVHYLSHHCVIQEGKTTKLRIVYDASAKSKGQQSLNDFLYKGPLMLEELTALLLRFRTHRIGLISDIEKAFLQLGLQEEDRDVTRFLWLKDITGIPSDDNIIHLRFCRVPFGVISSPFLLAATINFHLKQQNSPLSTQMARSLYVDNLVTGADDPEQAMQLYEEARTNFEKLSMNIRDWSSNDSTFMNRIARDVRNDSAEVSVLGLRWDTTFDTLQLSLKPTTITQKVETKRQALRTIASIYDPCGLIAPLTLSTRLFLQSLWVKKVKWDDKLTSSQQNEWATCTSSLLAIPNVTVPRYFNIPKEQEVEIHCFTDASTQCYSTVLYLRAHVANETVLSLVMSRSRLTPLRQKDTVTIPKLELLAVLIGTRLIAYVRQTLGLRWSKTYLWTDSQIVLGWLKSDKLLHPFVARRIDEIRKSTGITFRYVPSSMNPADIATRPLDPPSTIPPMWMEGPAYLKQPSHEWPMSPFIIHDPSENEGISSCTKEDIVNDRATVVTSIVTPDENWEIPEQGTVLPARTICKLQQVFFPQETNKVYTRLSKSLGLFVDSEGVLRCKGRYGNAVMPYSQKYPILLPTDSTVTATVIRRIHEGNNHVGVSHTLSLLREQYWIPKGRKAVSKILRKCVACTKYGGGPYKLPTMPDLPHERITYSPPFTYTGLDYLGPLMITEDGRPHKRWVCLFTCLAIRAVHLEMVNDLTSDEFMLALRRFAAQRGVPDLIISDNATHFKLAATVLGSPPASRKKLDWKFIPALSPWQGGFYERLVGMVKHCLIRTLDRSLLNGSQLGTVLKEIESVLNTRPLTTVGSDIEHVLSPHHFLSTSGVPLLEPPLDHEATSTIQSQLILGWKRTQKFLNEFKKMFQSQYLVGLRDRHRLHHQQPRILSHRAPVVGDVVQVKGDHKNRAMWKVGSITSLLPSGDGQPRTAQVTFPNGHVLNRSIAQLYPLEVEALQPTVQQASVSNPAASTPQPTVQQASNNDPPASPTPMPSLQSDTPQTEPSPMENGLTAGRRQPRNAAIQARQRIRGWTSSLFASAVQQVPMPT